MKQNIILGLLFLLIIGCKPSNSIQEKTLLSPQPDLTEVPRPLLTLKYGGQYSYGKDTPESGFGSIIIYPETDSTVLLYLSVNRGGPSYNSGSLFVRLKIINESAIYYTKEGYLENGCRLTFDFLKNSVKVQTGDENFECGFGNAVSATGYYAKDSDKYEDHFLTGGDERKIYFNKKEDLLYLNENQHK